MTADGDRLKVHHEIGSAAVKAAFRCGVDEHSRLAPAQNPELSRKAPRIQSRVRAVYLLSNYRNPRFASNVCEVYFQSTPEQNGTGCRLFLYRNGILSRRFAGEERRDRGTVIRHGILKNGLPRGCDSHRLSAASPRVALPRSCRKTRSDWLTRSPGHLR
jgi:hypothetical protein